MVKNKSRNQNLYKKSSQTVKFGQNMADGQPITTMTIFTPRCAYPSSLKVWGNNAHHKTLTVWPSHEWRPLSLMVLHLLPRCDDGRNVTWLTLVIAGERVFCVFPLKQSHFSISSDLMTIQHPEFNTYD